VRTLTRRVAGRNVISDYNYPLPLRQLHISDALGFTSVHVSRVMGIFRDRIIVDLSNGVPNVFDLSGHD
jgi:CRP-like cAMP-binding protein